MLSLAAIKQHASHDVIALDPILRRPQRFIEGAKLENEGYGLVKWPFCLNFAFFIVLMATLLS